MVALGDAVGDGNKVKYFKKGQHAYANGNYKEAVEHFKIAMDNGNCEARAELAWILYFEREGFDNTRSNGIELIRKLPPTKFEKLCANCKGVYSAIGIFSNDLKGNTTRFNLANESAGVGSKYGWYALGLYYDFKGNQIYLSKSNVRKHPRIIFEHGGDGDTIDVLLSEAHNCYYQAAYGYPPLTTNGINDLDAAHNKLGEIYYHKARINSNPKTAENIFENSVKEYEKAVAQGFPPAYDNLGQCYKFGNGVSHNLQTAFDMFSKARLHPDTLELRMSDISIRKNKDGKLIIRDLNPIPEHHKLDGGRSNRSRRSIISVRWNKSNINRKRSKCNKSH
jgi:TPR repeat protein